MSRSLKAVISVCILSAFMVAWFQFVEYSKPKSDYRPEAWRSLAVDELGKAFDATGSRTNFLAAAVDDDNQPVILGVSYVVNAVPWLAKLSDDLHLAEPLFLAADAITVPHPELFVINGDNFVFVENMRAGEKGGGVYSDFDLFDSVANETARFYRFNFRTGTTFHTRAEIVFVNQINGSQKILRPFSEQDARLTSLLSTASGFVAGGYVVLDRQLRSVPSLAYWFNDSKTVETFVFEEGFGPGSHWIDDILEIDSQTLIVVGASTKQRSTGRSENDGWMAVVNLESGTLTRIGESLPSRGQILVDHAQNGFHVITDDRIMQVSLEGQIVWSVGNTDTVKSDTVRNFVPRSTVLDKNGYLWVAGSAVNGDWGAWITQISDAGEIMSGNFFGSSESHPRFIGLLPANHGGVLAAGSLYCRRAKCGTLFARGFFLKFGPDGQLSKAERARFETYESRDEEINFYNKAPRECTQVDRAVCVAVSDQF